MKIVVFILLIVTSISLLFKDSISETLIPTNIKSSDSSSTFKNKYYSKINTSKQFTISNKFDTTIALLINYQLHSGVKRAFLIDLNKKIAFDSFLVSHGCGDSPWGEDDSKTSPKFSNIPESHCSSLGKYKISGRGYSNWGINIKYNLHGLESSNNNALNRLIVLHGWGDVSDDEVYPRGTPEGWGCPAFSNLAMTKLDSIFKSKDKPILLWAY